MEKIGEWKFYLEKWSNGNTGDFLHGKQSSEWKYYYEDTTQVILRAHLKKINELEFGIIIMEDGSIWKSGEFVNDLKSGFGSKLF